MPIKSASGDESVEHGPGKVEREWFTPTEAMHYLGVSRTTLYHLMDTGVLRYFVLKGVQKRRIKKEDLDALFEEGGQAQSEADGEKDKNRAKPTKKKS